MPSVEPRGMRLIRGVAFVSAVAALLFVGPDGYGAPSGGCRHAGHPRASAAVAAQPGFGHASATWDDAAGCDVSLTFSIARTAGVTVNASWRSPVTATRVNHSFLATYSIDSATADPAPTVSEFTRWRHAGRHWTDWIPYRTTLAPGQNDDWTAELPPPQRPRASLQYEWRVHIHWDSSATARGTLTLDLDGAH